MQFALLVYETETDFAARDDVERQTAYRAAHLDFPNSLKSAAAAIQSVVGGAGLKPPHTATTVRKRGGARQIVDGP